jgi:redox-sensing transcriptional repressor
LQQFKNNNTSWVLSEQIAAALGINPAQVRKDFSLVGLTGKRKSGYFVNSLLEKMNKMLGKNNRIAAVMTGFGPLGKAVYNEYFRKNDDTEIIAAFDTNVSGDGLVDSETGLSILPLSTMAEFIEKHKVCYGIIADSGSMAQLQLDRLVSAGVRGILSFSSMPLKIPKSCVVQNISPLGAMESVVYFTEHGGKSKAAA